MNCAQCQSENTQRIELIYEQGTSEIHTRSSSIGSAVSFGGGFSVGSGVTTTRGTQQSRLAKKMAPPGRAPTILALIAALILGGLAFLAANTPGTLATFICVACFLGAAICIAYSVYWEKSVREPKLDGWRKTWHCNRCGAVYYEPCAYDAYNATKPARYLFGGATAAITAMCLLVVGESMDSLAAADRAARGVTASTPSAARTRTQNTTRASREQSLKPRFLATTTSDVTVLDEQRRVICSVKKGQRVPAERMQKLTDTSGVYMAVSTWSDLCPGATGASPLRQRVLRVIDPSPLNAAEPQG
jgi:hypothetical protein